MGSTQRRIAGPLRGLMAAMALVASLLSLAILPARASAAETLYSGTCGTCPWTVDSEGTLTIGPGTLASNDNEVLDFWPWREYSAEIKRVVTDGKVVCGRSLYWCFFDLRDLESVDISSWDTSSVTHMGCLFDDCRSLVSVDLSSWDTSSLTSTTGMFSNCHSLESVDLSGWDTSSVEHMGSMFWNCSKISILDLSSWDTSSMTDMGFMFSGCSSLSALDDSGWDTSRVTNMDCIFQWCSSLESLDLSDWDTSSAMYMTGVFNGCSSLSSLDVSGWDTSSAIHMGNMFNDCQSLVTLDLSNWETSSLESTHTMFRGCSSLETLNLTGWDTSSVTSFNDMFSNCESLESITVGDKYQIKDADMFPDATAARGWWSVADETWYSKDEICANRSGIVDTYLNEGSTGLVDISECEIKLDQDEFVYTSVEFEPQLEIRDGSRVLIGGVDYERSYANNLNAGTASVTVTGIGDYTGTKVITFEIKPLDIAVANVPKIADQNWTGSAVTPSPKVDVGGLLFEGTDYTLSYESNVDVGTATVIITGINNYTGTKRATFKIVDPSAPTGPTWTRLAGNGRYDTMAKIVSEGWSGKTGGTVVVATGESFKDALAAAGLAGLDEAPVVLTAGKSLSSQAETQLKALKPSKIYVAGGTFAVSDATMSAIQRVTGVKPTRISGSNGCSTSAALAKAGGTRWGDTAIIATDKSFKDALSVAPVSYAKHWPILLAGGGKSLNADVISALKACGIKNAYIVGGELAVTKNVEDQLKKNGVTLSGRLAGDNAPQTSYRIGEFALKQGLTVANMAYATSQNFPDALGGAALCGKNKSVLVLCDDTAVNNLYFAINHLAAIKAGYVFGGELAFSKGLFDALPREWS